MLNVLDYSYRNLIELLYSGHQAIMSWFLCTSYLEMILQMNVSTKFNSQGILQLRAYKCIAERVLSLYTEK